MHIYVQARLTSNQSPTVVQVAKPWSWRAFPNPNLFVQCRYNLVAIIINIFYQICPECYSFGITYFYCFVFLNNMQDKLQLYLKELFFFFLKKKMVLKVILTRVYNFTKITHFLTVDFIGSNGEKETIFHVINILNFN